MGVRMMQGQPTTSSEGDAQEPARSLEEAKGEAVRRAVRQSNGNLVEAARVLGIGRATLYRLLKKYRITD